MFTSTSTFTAKSLRPIPPMQRDQTVLPAPLNLEHSKYRNSCSRAVSLTNARLNFLMFAIFKMNEHFQGLKTTLFSLYVLSLLICQHFLYLPNSGTAEIDVDSFISRNSI